MAAAPTAPRSPLENVINFLPGRGSSGQLMEKEWKHAFFHAAGLVVVAIGAVGLGAVYFILQPFLRPLLWAVLFGSVLHPFKRGLTDAVRKWLRGLQTSGTPLTIGVILLPVAVVEHSSQAVGNTVHRYRSSFAVVTIGSVTLYLACTFTPDSLLRLVIFIKDLLLHHTHDFFGYFSTLWVWTLVVGFVLLVTFYWSTNTSRLLCTTSILVWCVLFLHFASLLGSVRAPVLVAFFTMMVVGFVMEVNDVQAKYQMAASEDEDIVIPSTIETAWSVLTRAEHPKLMGVSAIKELAEKESSRSTSPSRSSSSTDVDVTKHPKVPLQRQPSTTSSPSGQGTSDPNASNVYIYGLIWACFLVQLWKNVWIWPLLAVPILYLAIKRSGNHFGLWSFLMNKLRELTNSAIQGLGERKDAFIPSPIQGIGKLVMRGEEKFTAILEGSVDTFTSIGSILLLLIFVIMATIYLLIQIHAESMHLVQVTSNLINTTVVHNPDLQGMLPEGVTNMYDSMIENAYEYGREWAVKMVKSVMNEQNETKAAQIEQQVLELWDKVYNTWMESSQAVNTKVSSGDTSSSMFGNIMAEMETFNFSALIPFLKENVDTFMAVFEASWTVVKGNISLALGALTATLSLLFGGGTALLNFLLSSIVFLTALFYLLSASGEQYKPIVLFNKLTPASNGGPRFGQAVEGAISDVFMASFKMAFFYGLWTWMIHTLFKVKIVYIPSALAAIFGAMPFLGTFWAAIPAVLELWLVHGQGVKAILMLICQILPMSCVDTAIYSEIKGGGHPYLTGLAVAGGMFCLGAEGAIFGPLLLCSLFVAMNMYDSVMSTSQDSPVNDSSARIGKHGGIFKSEKSNH